MSIIPARKTTGDTWDALDILIQGSCDSKTPTLCIGSPFLLIIYELTKKHHLRPPAVTLTFDIS